MSTLGPSEFAPQGQPPARSAGPEVAAWVAGFPAFMMLMALGVGYGLQYGWAQFWFLILALT